MKKEDKELLLKDICARLPYGVKVHYHLKRSGEDGVFSFDREHKNIGVLYYEHYSEDAKKDCNYDKEHFSIILCGCYYGEDIKPYLRPMSSMTDEEREEFRTIGGIMSYSPQHNTWALSAIAPEAYDWLNAHHFDYRGFIEAGLAIEAPKDMYKTE